MSILASILRDVPPLPLPLTPQKWNDCNSCSTVLALLGNQADSSESRCFFDVLDLLLPLVPHPSSCKPQHPPPRQNEFAPFSCNEHLPSLFMTFFDRLIQISTDPSLEHDGTPPLPLSSSRKDICRQLFVDAEDRISRFIFIFCRNSAGISELVDSDAIAPVVAKLGPLLLGNLFSRQLAER